MEEKIKFSGRKKSDYLKNINNEYCFQKCIHFFSLWKFDGSIESEQERERECGKKSDLRHYSIFFLDWPLVGLIKFDLKRGRRSWNVFLRIEGILFSIKWIVYRVEVDSLLESCILIKLYMICGKITSLERSNCSHSTHSLHTHALFYGLFEQ